MAVQAVAHLEAVASSALRRGVAMAVVQKCRAARILPRSATVTVVLLAIPAVVILRHH